MPVHRALVTPPVVALCTVALLQGLVAQAARPGKEELDVPFVPQGGPDQQLDLYAPAGGRFPTILFIHEGGLTSGGRKDAPYPAMGRSFQSLGIGWVATNFRLAPDHKWPAQAEDVVAAFD
jgi:acetyl esterase/lipase